MGMEPLRPQSNQEAGDFVKQMAGVFKKTKAALEWTTEGMKRYYNWGQQPDNLKVRDKVWLDTRDIKMDQPSKKLDYKRVQMLVKLSCYLKPLSHNFATFNSFLYQPKILLPDCKSPIGFQITTASEHLICILGFKELQVCLNPKIFVFKALQPTLAENLILLFIVPEPMVTSFQKMQFKGKAAHW